MRKPIISVSMFNELTWVFWLTISVVMIAVGAYTSVRGKLDGSISPATDEIIAPFIIFGSFAFNMLVSRPVVNQWLYKSLPETHLYRKMSYKDWIM